MFVRATRLTSQKKNKLRILAEINVAHAKFFVENTQKIGEIQPGADNNLFDFSTFIFMYHMVYSNSMEAKTREPFMIFPSALRQTNVTVLGYGALLSESSSRLTFPNLNNFRHVRVKGIIRVFGHPHVFLLKEGVVSYPDTLKIASLSAEPAPDNNAAPLSSSSSSSTFVVAAFDVVMDDLQRRAFMEREGEYKIETVKFYALERDDDDDDGDDNKVIGEGIICLSSKDSDMTDLVMNNKLPRTIDSIWHWSHDSGILPLNMYLRHCLLAVEKAGGAARESFLKETFLADRRTTLADYLQLHEEEVMNSTPPAYLEKRFNG